MPPGLQDGSGPSSAFDFAPSLDPLRFGERNTATLELLSPVARSLQQVGWGLRLVAPMGLLFGIAAVLASPTSFPSLPRYSSLSISELREMKMQPALERALKHREILKG